MTTPGPEAKWTLWVDYVALLGRDAGYAGKTAAEFAQRLADRSPLAGRDDARIWLDPMPERPDEAAVEIPYDGVEDGEPLRFISWYEIARIGRGFIMGQFNWVLIQRAMGEPEIVALTELIETEVLNACCSIGRPADSIGRRRAAPVRRPIPKNRPKTPPERSPGRLSAAAGMPI